MRATVIALVVLSILLAACGRIHGPTAELDAYIAAKEPFFDQWVKDLSANLTVPGIDDAARSWDSKKAELKAKRDAIDAAPQGMNKDWQSLYLKTQSRTSTELDSVEGRLNIGDDEAAKAKFKALRQDIGTTLKLR